MFSFKKKQNKKKTESSKRITLRIPFNIIDALDSKRKILPGAVSRNQFIINTLWEQLKTETKKVSVSLLEETDHSPIK